MPSPQSFNLILYKRREEGVTDIQESLNTLLVKYYMDLIARVLCGVGMKSHTYFYVVYTLALHSGALKFEQSNYTFYLELYK